MNSPGIILLACFWRNAIHTCGNTSLKINRLTIARRERT